MVKQRITWLLCCLGSLVFLVFYQRWLAWLMLSAVLLIPLFSLLVSLPAMITARLETHSPGRVTVGTPAALSFRCVSKGITPLWSCRVLVTQGITGKHKRLRRNAFLPTDRSSVLFCRLTRVRVYDYLGLIGLPLRGQRTLKVVVEPQPIPIPNEQEADADSVFAWKPKNGGFSENHELRLYAPGDSLRQIHWKLSAKTGKLIIREPMIPDPGKVLVKLELKGSPEELERLLGRVLWLGQQLTRQQIPFELLTLTAEGVRRAAVSSLQSLELAMDELLSSRPIRDGRLETPAETFTRQYTLGGEPHEE